MGSVTYYLKTPGLRKVDPPFHPDVWNPQIDRIQTLPFGTFTATITKRTPQRKTIDIYGTGSGGNKSFTLKWEGRKKVSATSSRGEASLSLPTELNLSKASDQESLGAAVSVAFDDINISDIEIIVGGTIASSGKAETSSANKNALSELGFIQEEGTNIWRISRETFNRLVD